MNRRRVLYGITILAVLTLTALLGRGVHDARAQAGAARPFAVAHIQLEQNATDGDFEVVLEAMGGGEGLAKLTVTAPNGKTIVDFTTPQASALGMRQFRFETPEPKDLKGLQAAYPAGAYTLAGTTASGSKLQGSATLSHALPAAPKLVNPAPEAEGVATKGLVMRWTAVPQASAYNVYLEQDELGVNVNAKLPGTSTSFVVPDGFLVAGTEYTMGVGAEFKSGNATYTEATFKTAAGK